MESVAYIFILACAIGTLFLRSPFVSHLRSENSVPPSAYASFFLGLIGGCRDKLLIAIALIAMEDA